MLLVALDMVLGGSMPKLLELTASGDFKKTLSFLEKIRKLRIDAILDRYGQKGVDALSDATPKRTGVTANSWRYEKKNDSSGISLEWYNDSLALDGKTPLVILIIKGHGTRNGGYVPPNDFLTPIMEGILKEATDAVWKAVTSYV